MHPSRRTPLLRGLAGATIATFVALASHVWVGGAMPGMLGIVVPWVLSLMVCVLLAGRRLSVIRLGISVAVSQALFHTLFVLGSLSVAGGFAPHVHGAPLVLSSDGAALIPADSAMWIAHGIAAAITVVVLHRGERILSVLLQLASRIAAWIARATVAPARRIVPVSIRWQVVAAVRRSDPLGVCVRRRGPPLRLI